MNAVAVALAGSLGAISRFVLDGHIRARYSQNFPWATLIINITGSFVLGCLSGALLHHHDLTNVETVIGMGFCGGYTTFSTASFETVRLLERREYGRAIANAAGSLGATIAAAAIGVMLGQWL
jgi:CrcB protein